MYKITLLALSVEPAGASGYRLTSSVYCQGDRQPRQVDTYEPLTHDELEELVLVLAHTQRPGWEYTPYGGQPPLWES